MQKCKKISGPAPCDLTRSKFKCTCSAHLMEWLLVSRVSRISRAHESFMEGGSRKIVEVFIETDSESESSTSSNGRSGPTEVTPDFVEEDEVPVTVDVETTQSPVMDMDDNDGQCVCSMGYSMCTHVSAMVPVFD